MRARVDDSSSLTDSCANNGQTTWTYNQGVIASGLALLAHAPAHKLLRALAAHVQPALAQTSELELLCAPLEPFARAAAARARAQAEGKEGGGKPDGARDWRRKKKLAHEQAGMAVGLYQLEELVL